MARRISGLSYAALAENPWGKNSRPQGAKAKGLRFEKKVATLLPTAVHGQWFNFVDNNGSGFCCTDILFVQEDTLWVAECKLTDWSEADDQINLLYVPVLKALWDGPVRGVVVAKHLTPLTQRSRVVGSWEEALSHPSPILHAVNTRTLTAPRSLLLAPKWSRKSYIFGLAPQRADLG